MLDNLAGEFRAACHAVDPECDADTILRLNDQARQAWFSCAEITEKLDALLPVLCAAAELAGAPTGVAKLVEESNGLRLALCADPRKAHRRRVWEAWNTTGGRCGRWSALRRLDVTIRHTRTPRSCSLMSSPSRTRSPGSKANSAV